MSFPIKPGDSTRLLRVFLDNVKLLQRYLRRYSADRAEVEDFLQETILRALKAERTKQVEEPKAFLFGIARNVARKARQKNARSVVDLIEDFVSQEYLSEEPPVEDQLDSRQRLFVFLEAIALLPAQCQKVFVLRKIYGWSHLAIAKRLGISVSTVEKHIATGLKRCRDYELSRSDAGVKTKAINE